MNGAQRSSDSGAAELDPLERWIADLLAGALAPADGERFAQRLREDPAARRRYVELAMLHGMLQWEFSSATAAAAEEAKETALALRVPTSAERASAADRAPAASRPARRRRPLRMLRWSLNAAAALLAVALLAWQFGPWATMATLVDEQGAEWTGADRPQGIGAVLRPQTLHLAAGVGELRFRNGATVILQGPAELELRSPTSVRLRSGRLVARAPDGAHGFTVEAAGMEVVDLGTEFGVATSAAGAEVHVFEGAVEAGRAGARDATDKLRLGLGQAARYDAGKEALESTGFAAAGFVRALPGELADPTLTQGLIAWWTFDEDHGVVAADASGNNHPGTLHHGTFAEASAPGKFGRALSLDGTGCFVTVPWHSDFDFSAMTIQAWIKPAAPQSGDAQILSQLHGMGLAVPNNAFMKYYFWDRDALMAYRFEPGTWYHLVATYDGRQRVFYVDGVRIGTFASVPPHGSREPLAIGVLNFRGGTFFHGLIDDLRLYGRALSQDEVRRLFLAGQAVAP
jgi:ferric-dicitrate binding protein FerR (iron transport regulator)